MRLTYEWNGGEHHATWDRGVVYCSYEKLGREACEQFSDF